MSKIDDSDDMLFAIHLLTKLVEFVEIQEREGLIDGSADPDLYVYCATQLIDKYKEQQANDTTIQNNHTTTDHHVIRIRDSRIESV